MNGTNHLTQGIRGTTISRRTLTKLFGASLATPMLASLLAACGGDDDETDGDAAPSPTTGEIAATAVSGAPTPMDTFRGSATETPAPSAGAPATATTASEATATPEPATTPTEEAKIGGTLNQSIINDPDTLDPALSSSITSSSIFQFIYESLVYIDEDRLPAPWVGRQWEINADGTEIAFTIEEGILFHDGTPLDAEAVKYNFDRMLNPDFASIRKTGLGTLTAVEAPDAKTLEFSFSAPYAPFFTNLYGNGISSPAAIELHGDAYGHNPVGSGAYTFKSWDLGQSVSLERNPDFVQRRADYNHPGPARVETLTWKIIRESATRNAALLAGELDIAGVDLTQAESVQNNDDFEVYIWKDRNGFIFIEYNHSKFPFNDLAVRQMMAYAMNRDEIVRSAYNGFATANLLPIPTGVAGWNESLEEFAYPYDLEKAKQTLTDGGFAQNADGAWEKDGQKLEFTMLVYSGNDPLRLSAEIAQATLREIGVDCELEVLDFGAELPRLNAGDFQCDIMRWTSSDPNILSLMFKSPGWTKQMNDPELDALCVVADTTLDPEKRLDAVHDVVKYLLDKAIVAPIVTDWALWAVHDYVKNYSLDVFGNARIADVWLDK